jgi:peptidoglycan/xylan/chitin deacetylase (PgdA/CDA1 family)
VKNKKELLARLLANPVTKKINNTVRKPDLLCLNYHRITEVDLYDEGVISASPEEFDWQAGFLSKHVNVAKGKDICALLQSRGRLRKSQVCLTFDDGYVDNYEAGIVLMERYKLSGIFFITTGFVGSMVVPHWDRIAYAVKKTNKERLIIPAIGDKKLWEFDLQDRQLAIRRMLKQYKLAVPSVKDEYVQKVEEVCGHSAYDAPNRRSLFMTWEQIRHLHELGHYIGAHTHSHPSLATLGEAGQEEELRLCREIIQNEIGHCSDLLAYPFGGLDAFSETTRRVARRCGYVGAFSFYGGRNVFPVSDAFDIKRIDVSPSASRKMFEVRTTAGFPY